MVASAQLRIMGWVALVQLLLCATIAAADVAPFLSEKYLNELKSEALTWKPGRNFHASTSLSSINALIGHSETLQNARAIKGKDGARVFGKSNPAAAKLTPDSFDSRIQWPFCNQTISRIADTGFCGSHWAVSVVQSMADRVCIHSGGTRKEENFSALHLMQCCRVCGQGCDGGYPYQAWKYIESRGVATGGDYGSKKGCKPYSVESPCNYNLENSGCTATKQVMLKCPGGNSTRCTNRRFYAEHESTLHKVMLVSKVPNSDEFTQAWTPEFIKKEIQNNGPVTGTMRVFEDFLSYKSGIYKPSKNAKKIDDLTLRIIGWGKRDTWNTGLPRSLGDLTSETMVTLKSGLAQHFCRLIAEFMPPLQNCESLLETTFFTPESFPAVALSIDRLIIILSLI